MITIEKHYTSDELDIVSELLRNLKDLVKGPFNLDSRLFARQLERIASSQREDGSFRLLEEKGMPHDAYVDFCVYPTVLCSALLMKAILLFPERYSGYLHNIEGALDSVAKLSLHGDGYDYLDVQMEYLELYLDAGLLYFIDMYPDASPAFTKMIEAITEEYGLYIERKEFIHGFGVNYESRIREIHRLLSQHRIFTYGTLMRGESNHSCIEEQYHEGDGSIRSYNLYDLGCYPGIRPSVHSDRRVYGEVYSIDSKCLDIVNRLECEGSLYTLKCTEVQLQTRAVVAGVYVYNRKARLKDSIHTGSWKCRRLYAAYGSNMNLEQMKKRCPGAICLGTSEIRGYRLVFRKNIHRNVYATILRKAGFSAPVVLWAISEKDERNLDMCEGYRPDLISESAYIKKKIELEFKDESVPALVYVMNRGEAEGVPEYAYYNLIVKGYFQNGIEIDALIRALEESSL